MFYYVVTKGNPQKYVAGPFYRRAAAERFVACAVAEATSLKVVKTMRDLAPQS